MYLKLIILLLSVIGFALGDDTIGPIDEAVGVNEKAEQVENLVEKTEKVEELIEKTEKLGKCEKLKDPNIKCKLRCIPKYKDGFCDKLHYCQCKLKKKIVPGLHVPPKVLGKCGGTGHFGCDIQCKLSPKYTDGFCDGEHKCICEKKIL